MSIQSNIKDAYEYAFILTSAKSDIHTQWILNKFNQTENTKNIKNELLKLINTEYDSQESAKIQTITNILNETGDLKWLTEQALKVPFSLGNSSLAEFIHCNTLFKACVEYDKTNLNIDSIHLIMNIIDEKLSNPIFIKKFKDENPDIIESANKFYTKHYLENIKNKQKINTNTNETESTQIIKITKPKYTVWGIAISMIAGTCLGLFYYLKKKN